MVTSIYEYTGGLIGWNSNPIGVITDCFATGDVSGIDYTGGFAGRNDSDINTSYSSGFVIGNSDSEILTTSKAASVDSSASLNVVNLLIINCITPPEVNSYVPFPWIGCN